jgi:hypothetical protein
MTEQHPTSLDDREFRLAIAKAIKAHLVAAGKRRKYLVRDDLSISAVNKALAGDFSEATLTKIETRLDKKFRDVASESEAPADKGAYTRKQVSRFEKTFLCMRQLYSNPSVINAYLMDIQWDKAARCLMFVERDRADKSYTQHGHVYIPGNLPFASLLTNYEGSLRQIVLNLPDDDGVARGIILGFYRPSGPIRLPVCAPIVLRALTKGETPKLGFIDCNNESYAEYAMLLNSVVAGQYALVLQGPSTLRPNLSVVEQSVSQSA